MRQTKTFKRYKTVVRNGKDGQTMIAYYETPIVTFDKQEIVLKTGKWRTRTTMTRMNQVSRHFRLGYRVMRKEASWFVEYQEKTHGFTSEQVRLDRRSGEVKAVS